MIEREKNGERSFDLLQSQPNTVLDTQFFFSQGINVDSNYLPTIKLIPTLRFTSLSSKSLYLDEGVTVHSMAFKPAPHINLTQHGFGQPQNFRCSVLTHPDTTRNNSELNDPPMRFEVGQYVLELEQRLCLLSLIWK